VKNIPTYEDFVNEAIKASDAYDTSDAVQTVIDGKRELVFISTMKGPLYRANNKWELHSMNHGLKNGLKSIKVDNKTVGDAWVLYRTDKKRAQKLADYAASKEGFLRDETPDEARLIGNLLDYRKSDIEEYVKKRYKL